MNGAEGYIEGLSVEETNWGHLAAIAEVNVGDCFKLWSRVRTAADDELQSGRRGAKVAGENSTPYSLAHCDPRLIRTSGNREAASNRQ
jgi:hypothetical protein